MQKPSEDVDSQACAQAPRTKPRYPKFPIPVGKARQKLSQAIICSDHELASWIDGAVMTGNVIGSDKEIAALRERLDEVMESL